MKPGSPDIVLCDLDGVVWLAHTPIAGAPEAIARLRDEGITVVFVTNNSGPTIAQHEAALAKIGIPAEGAVVSSALAGAFLVNPGERVLTVGGPGVVEAVTARGAIPVDPRDEPGEVDAVVVGLRRDFDYSMMDRAASAIRAGARYVATNSDATYPTPTGAQPGAGSLVAAVTTASGTEPIFGGKPHTPIGRVVQELVGERWDLDRVVVIGDRVSTDGDFARALGCRYGLVRSGVTPPGAVVDTPVAYDTPSIAELADLLIAERRGEG
ncbi:MAG: HAD family hydrolase [Ilumatobacter coccineus]|uniref:HAD family hydrolase n=1 Tax=Ilumatobacter coccineus TaxID=467094 RepID=A0A2G6K7M8_9ACTN|nr:MAG: HAD family hydrolase [Ilumatobacter coccineus]